MTGSTAICIDANEFPVSSVVIFRTQAEVTRSFPIELQAGNNDLEIKGLPDVIQQDSLRIQGVGKGVTLLDHAIAFNLTPSRPGSGEAAKVKELRATKKAADAQLKVLVNQGDIVLGYSRSMTAEHVKTEAFMEYMAVFNQAGVQNIDAVKQKEREIEEIDKQIKKELEASRTSSERNEHLRQATIFVVLHSETELKTAELRITYVVNGASWTPAYEIRATTDTNGQLNETVSLHYKAAITQNTGEDWKNTKLTLNTTSPALARVTLPHSGLKIRPGAASNGENGGFPDRLNKGRLSAQQMNLVQHQLQAAQRSAFGAPQLQQQQQQQQMQQASANYVAQQQPIIVQPPPQQPIIVGQPPLQTVVTGQPLQPVVTGQPLQPVVTGQPPQPVTVQWPPQQPITTQYPAGFGGLTAAPYLPPDFTGAAAVGPATMGDTAFNYADAVAESTAVSATYKIEGKTTILSGIATHRVVISTSTVLPVEVYVVAMPRVQPWVGLQAKIKNITTEPLLAGLASIFNDDSYVSSTQMPLVSPGDSFDCSLGIDNKIKVSFAHKDGSVVINNIPFAGNTESGLATNTIKVKNNRNVPINRLIIRDAVPAGQDPVKVLLKTPAELATVASVDATVKVAEGGVARWSKEKTNSREEGLIEWVLDDIQSGEEKKVELAWSVEVPQGFKWSYSS